MKKNNPTGALPSRIGVLELTLFVFMVGSFVDAKDEIPSNLIAGKKIGANAKLKKGDKVVGFYAKKAYLVEVLDVQRNNRLKILWVETKEESDGIRPDELYEFGDSSESRKSRSAALPEAYRALDKNGDGQVGLYEWDRKKYSEFRKLDKNNDGLLTPKELAGKATTPTTTNNVAAKDGETKDKPPATTPAP